MEHKQHQKSTRRWRYKKKNTTTSILYFQKRQSFLNVHTNYTMIYGCLGDQGNNREIRYTLDVEEAQETLRLTQDTKTVTLNDEA